MYSNNSNPSRAASARGFMALIAIMLAMGLGLMARLAEAAPFAYVTDLGSGGNVWVIDTATNTVVATIPVVVGGYEVAVAPNGKHVYVTNEADAVSVIDTTTNMVVATVRGEWTFMGSPSPRMGNTPMSRT
jgi:YVTN family beta-propeller protein